MTSGSRVFSTERVFISRFLGFQWMPRLEAADDMLFVPATPLGAKPFRRTPSDVI